MKKIICYLAVAISLSTLIAAESFARGPGRGRSGGGRSAGATRGAARNPGSSSPRSFTPGGATTRLSAPGGAGASTLRQLPSGGLRPGVGLHPDGPQLPRGGRLGSGQNPIAGQLGSGPSPTRQRLRGFLDLPDTGAPGVSGLLQDRAGVGPRDAGLGSQLENGPGTRVDERRGNRQEGVAGRYDQHGQRQDQRQTRATEHRQQVSNQRQQRASEIRNGFQNNHPRYDFWTNHPSWATWRFRHPYRWATWGALTGWFGWPASSSSYYYDYAPDVVYVNGEELGTVNEFTDQAQQLAQAGALSAQQDDAAQPADSMEWMSLGVFVLTPEHEGDTNMLLQLAVSKEGTIAGTYHNRLIEQTLPVQGSIDRNTQRAAWTIGDKQDTVFETGVYNLTQEQTSVLVHFGKDRTETWLLVRMDEPQGQPQP